jgi:hypothetical protein
MTNTNNFDLSSIDLSIDSFILSNDDKNILNPDMQIVYIVKFSSKENAIEFQNALTHTREKKSLFFKTTHEKVCDLNKRDAFVLKFMEVPVVRLVESQKLANILSKHEYISNAKKTQVSNQETISLEELFNLGVVGENNFASRSKNIFVIPEYNPTDFEILSLCFKNTHFVNDIGSIDELTSIKNVNEITSYLINKQKGGKRKEARSKTPKIQIGKRVGKYYIKNGKKVYV